jgi:hypothetical protein
MSERKTWGELKAATDPEVVRRGEGKAERSETMSEYRKYRRTAIAEIADWHPDFDMAGVSISEPDRAAGSPKPGDKIARNPANHDDRWLIAADYFAANFEPLPDTGGTHD